MRNDIAPTPEPPYYAVIFTSSRSDTDTAEFDEIHSLLEDLAEMKEGYLGMESYRDEEKHGVSVVYFKDMESILQWKNEPLHVKAKQLGRDKWFHHYKIRIAKVESDFQFGM